MNSRTSPTTDMSSGQTPMGTARSRKMELRNMPLGIVWRQKFAATKLKLATGDILLGYSDAFYE